MLNSDDITINKLTYTNNAAVLLQVQGEKTKGIQVLNTDTTAARQKLSAGFGAPPTVVSWEEKKPTSAKKKKTEK